MFDITGFCPPLAADVPITGAGAGGAGGGGAGGVGVTAAGAGILGVLKKHIGYSPVKFRLDWSSNCCRKNWITER